MEAIQKNNEAMWVTLKRKYAMQHYQVMRQDVAELGRIILGVGVGGLSCLPIKELYVTDRVYT